MIKQESEIECPYCGYKTVENLPVDRCIISYACKNCKEVISPLEGDCCVFCSYSKTPCPSKQ